MKSIDAEFLQAKHRTGNPIFIYRFPSCTVFLLPDLNRAVTNFPDGTAVPGIAHDSEHYWDVARRRGYAQWDPFKEANRFLYLCEHELMHTVYSRWYNLEVDPVLWAVAHPDDPTILPVAYHYQHEDAVQGFQTFMNDKYYWDRNLQNLRELRGESLYSLREDALELVKPMREHLGFPVDL